MGQTKGMFHFICQMGIISFCLLAESSSIKYLPYLTHVAYMDQTLNYIILPTLTSLELTRTARYGPFLVSVFSVKEGDLKYTPYMDHCLRRKHISISLPSHPSIYTTHGH